MKIFGFEVSRPPKSEQKASETIAVSAGYGDFLGFFGVSSNNLPLVTTDTALTVPAVAAAVAFLSRTMAALPFHAYKNTKEGAQRLTGKVQTIVHDAPNDGQDSFKFRQYFWQQVFTGGRGLAWIERSAQSVEALWPMDPNKTTIKRVGGRLFYDFDGKEYPASDVIDVPFMLRSDGLGHYGPINLASKAIQLALAMNEYGSSFFAGGGVPPLALEGPLPAGADAIKRAQADIKRAIDAAKGGGESIFPLPGGYKLNPVGIDPAKSQMIEARRFQVEEIARAYQLPPVFLQDLSRATFSNAEQQDLHLVKHLIGQWAEALEGEMNLKLFGRGNTSRYVEHNLDGLLRGDFKTRMEGLARAIQTAQMTPNEARALENRPKHANPDADNLLVQGATVTLGMQVTDGGGDQPPPDNDNTDNGDEAQAA
ncbi:MAG: phage portal protein [Agrobacterium sp. SCN 61-19]|nr:MAG: phage portal protein [Agrobacterium sp. SCN 61-19]